MKIKVHHLLVSAVLSLASVASAQIFTGAIGIQEDTSQTGSYTANSLTLDSANFTEPSSASGTFLATVPNGTEITAYSSTISGLSSTPEFVSISDFLLIGTPGPAVFGSPGTTPNNRFDFDLQTLEEAQPGGFIGAGTLVDTTGTYADTSAEFILNFSGANNYSFTLEAVPEPATGSLVLAGLGLLPFLRRKS
jgi:hypothetical protein